MLRNPLTLLVTAVVGAAAFAIAAPAHAKPAASGESVSITVSYRDLDLGTVPGARSLLRRIHSAADEICSGNWNYGACVSKAVDGAVVRLNNPLVSSLSGRASAANH